MPRGKASSTENTASKTVENSPFKAVARTNHHPPSGALVSENLEVVSSSTSSSTFSASEFRTELLNCIFVFMEKFEDAQIEEYAAAKTATVANCLVSTYFLVAL